MLPLFIELDLTDYSRAIERFARSLIYSCIEAVSLFPLSEEKDERGENFGTYTVVFCNDTSESIK